MWSEPAADRSEAQQREAAIKRLPRVKKLHLIGR
jgi:predicted GIY-YIG superfamily endonuclease